MSGRPSKAVPGGCIIGMVGIAAILGGVLCIFGFFAALDAPPDRPPIIEAWKFGLAAFLSIAFGLWIIRLGWRLALKADMTDPDDPNKPTMRF